MSINISAGVMNGTLFVHYGKINITRLMKKLLVSLLLFLPLLTIVAQTVTVINADDGKPVSDVAVYNETRTQFGYTNPAGRINLSGFRPGQTLYFQHFSYERVSFTTEELKAAGWIVKLVTRTFEVEEFIVSANRWEQKSDEVPNHIIVVAQPAV